MKENVYQNRSFKYGDGLFETMRVSKGKVLFLEDHYERLILGFEALGLDYREGKVKSALDFERWIDEFIQQEGLVGQNFRFRMPFFREEGGLYTPMCSTWSATSEYRPLESGEYTDHDFKEVVDVVPEQRLPMDKYAKLKTTSALPYILAGLYKKQMNLNDVILLNHNDCIAEAQSSNVFLCKDDVLYTPSLDQGCIMGVMRKQILKLSNTLGMTSVEKSITIRELYEADEIFLTNVIQGLRSVHQIRSKSKIYGQKIRKDLLNLLNTSL